MRKWDPGWMLRSWVRVRRKRLPAGQALGVLAKWIGVGRRVPDHELLDPRELVGVLGRGFVDGVGNAVLVVFQKAAPVPYLHDAADVSPMASVPSQGGACCVGDHDQPLFRVWEYDVPERSGTSSSGCPGLRGSGPNSSRSPMGLKARTCSSRWRAPGVGARPAECRLEAATSGITRDSSLPHAVFNWTQIPSQPRNRRRLVGRRCRRRPPEDPSEPVACRVPR